MHNAYNRQIHRRRFANLMRLTANDRHLRHIKEALLKNFLYFYFFFFFYTYCTCHTFKFTVTLIHGCFKDFTPWHLSPVFWSLCYQRINCKRPCLWILIEAVGWAFFFSFSVQIHVSIFVRCIDINTNLQEYGHLKTPQMYSWQWCIFWVKALCRGSQLIIRWVH